MANTDPDSMETSVAKLKDLVRDRGFSERTLKMVDTIGAFVNAMKPGTPDAEMERVIRDQWLPTMAADKASPSDGLGHLVLATIERDRGDLDASVRSLRTAIPLLQEKRDERNLARALGMLASAVESQGDRVEALRIRHDAQLPVVRRLGDDRALLDVLGEVGRGFRELGRGDEAERLAREELLPTAIRRGTHERVEALLALWTVLHDRGGHEEILALARDEILPLSASINNAEGVAKGAFAGSQALIGLKRMDEAATWLRDVGIPAADSAGDPGLRVLVREGLADALATKQKPDRAGARRVLREVIRIASDAGMQQAVEENRGLLRQLG